MKWHQPYCFVIPLVLFLRLVSFACFTLLSLLRFWPVLSAYEMRFVRIFSFEQNRAQRNKRKEKLAKEFRETSSSAFVKRFKRRQTVSVDRIIYHSRRNVTTSCKSKQSRRNISLAHSSRSRTIGRAQHFLRTSKMNERPIDVNFFEHLVNLMGERMSSMNWIWNFEFRFVFVLHFRQVKAGEG